MGDVRMAMDDESGTTDYAPLSSTIIRSHAMTIPTETNAIRFYKTGGPDVLTWETVKLGAPGAGEVTLRNKACGLNFIDTYHRSGLYPVAVALGHRPGRGGGGRGTLGRTLRISRSATVSPIARHPWAPMRMAQLSGRQAGEDPGQHRRQDRRRHDAAGHDG
jgi:hypothetical protein